MGSSPRLAVAGISAAALALGACTLALDFDATSKQTGAPGGPFCVDHKVAPMKFCDDFDSTPISMAWPKVEETNGKVTQDAMAAVSAPNSMLSTVLPVGVMGNVRAVSTLSFPDLSNLDVKLHITFWMRIDQFDTTPGAKNTVFQFLYGPLGDFNQIVLNAVSNGDSVALQLVENGQGPTAGPSMYAQHGPFVTKPTAGKWMKIFMEIKIGQHIGTNNSVTLLFDDVSQFDQTLTVPLKGDTPRFELGVGWVDTTVATQAWAVRYDNFLIEQVPL
jgi:hypothetical protein